MIVPDSRPVLDVIAEAIHRAECGCTGWHPKDPEDDTYDRYAAAVLAACQGATVEQQAQLVEAEIERRVMVSPGRPVALNTPLGRQIAERLGHPIEARVVGLWTEDPS